jgi:hypothetical protein
LSGGRPDICELDKCLTSDPSPRLALFAYRNMVSGIWQRHFPESRSGKSLSDDEYRWVHGAILCLERAIKIWESMPSAKQEDIEVFDCYRDTKKTLKSIMGYGLFYYSCGQMLERDLRNIQLPPLRCLEQPAELAPPEPREAHCTACGAANRMAFAFCRKCGTRPTAQ